MVGAVLLGFNRCFRSSVRQTAFREDRHGVSSVMALTHVGMREMPSFCCLASPDTWVTWQVLKTYISA